MREKQPLILAIVVLGTITGVFIGLYWHSRSERLIRSQFIDEDHFNRLQLGMQREDVEAVLGGVSGDFTTTNRKFSHSCPLPLSFKCDDCQWEFWTGDEGQIEVLFNEKATVVFLFFARGF
jgi:hypothetical protein